MSDLLWVDTNVLLRFLTGDPPDQAERARRLVARAENGEVTLRLTILVVAEMVWVLGSFYKYPRERVAEVLLQLVIADGIEVDDHDRVVGALAHMAAHNVDFADAYLAEIVRSENGTVMSFDRDFRRLGVTWVEPT
jgi:predicted nucleic acid-binding protein